MTDITIPDEALEAAARAIATMEGVPEAWVLRLVRARFAILAMLRAWPNMFVYQYGDDGSHSIILPLHPEKETSA